MRELVPISSIIGGKSANVHLARIIDRCTGMHVTLLNIRHGGGHRAQSLLDWLTSSIPDVIVLPEWRNNASGDLIKKGLEVKGFHVATAAQANRTSNGILLAVKDACQIRRATPEGGKRGELLVANNSAGWTLLAAYFPQGKAKSPFFNACIEEAVRSPTAPFLILGDLNTGRNDIDREGNGVPFVCADQFDALQTEAGLFDLWRIEHGKTQEWSWRSRINGFRVDHALANAAFRNRFATVRCLYDHTPRETGLSDHSALILKSSAASTEIQFR
jgi:exonuclease III